MQSRYATAPHPEISELTRQLTALRNQVAHSAPLSSDDLVNLTMLAEQCDQLGLRDLAHWAHAELAAVHLDRLARTAENVGNRDEAALWRARAATLHQAPGADHPPRAAAARRIVSCGGSGEQVLGSRGHPGPPDSEGGPASAAAAASCHHPYAGSHHELRHEGQSLDHQPDYRH